jgi:hypothetical protein
VRGVCAAGGGEKERTREREGRARGREGREGVLTGCVKQFCHVSLYKGA